MSMPGAGGGMKALRTLRRDDSVTSQPLSKGLLRRIFRFAAPYRKKLLLFLILIIVDAAIGGANPLIYRAIIDDGILPRRNRTLVELAFAPWVLAVLDAVLARERWHLGPHRRGPDLRHADDRSSPISSRCRSRSSPGPRRRAGEPPEQRRP